MGVKEVFQKYTRRFRKTREPIAGHQLLEFDPSSIYDASHNGIGEIPYSHVPIHKKIISSDKKIENDNDFVDAVESNREIQDLRKRGLHVGVTRGVASEINLFISNHKDAIKTGLIASEVAAGVGIVVGGLIFIHKHHEEIQKNKSIQK